MNPSEKQHWLPAGAPGSHAGVPGSRAGVPGSHAGVPGSHAGVPVSHAGVPGSHAGVPGSRAGVPGSHAGVPGSRAGEDIAYIFVDNLSPPVPGVMLKDLTAEKIPVEVRIDLGGCDFFVP
ncbi:MAG: hypothetical protein LBG28_04115 [Tannerella sp.]|nr:hypothetical protein [Tannerella sp.]